MMTKMKLVNIKCDYFVITSYSIHYTKLYDEDGTGYFESNILYSAIRKIRVDNWDNSFLTVVMEDGTEEQVFIFEKDTLGEIKIVSPYLTVQDLFRITTKWIGYNNLVITSYSIHYTKLYDTEL